MKKLVLKDAVFWTRLYTGAHASAHTHIHLKKLAFFLDGFLCSYTVASLKYAFIFFLVAFTKQIKFI